jgi:hypothetical protein
MGNLQRSLATVTATLLMIQDVCAANPKDDIIPPGMSRVHAQGSSLRNFLAVLKPIGTTMVVYILSVDGKKAKLSGSQREVVVPPGLHNLAIRCDFTADSMDRSASGHVTYEFLADHDYEIQAGIPCVSSVVDKTAPAVAPPAQAPPANEAH